MSKQEVANYLLKELIPLFEKNVPEPIQKKLVDVDCLKKMCLEALSQK